MSWGQAIAAGLQFAGTGAELAGQYYSQKRQMSENRRAYARQLTFNERMAREGPTWAVEGLKAAGLNPILAASGGIRPGGGGSVTMPGQLPPVGRGLSEGIGKAAFSALQFKQMREGARKLEEEANAAKAQAEAQNNRINGRGPTAAQRMIEASIANAVAGAWTTRQQGFAAQSTAMQNAMGLNLMASNIRLNNIREQLALYELPSAKANAALWDTFGAFGAGAKTFGGLGVNLLKMLPAGRGMSQAAGIIKQGRRTGWARPIGEFGDKIRGKF